MKQEICELPSDSFKTSSGANRSVPDLIKNVTILR